MKPVHMTGLKFAPTIRVFPSDATPHAASSCLSGRPLPRPLRVLRPSAIIDVPHTVPRTPPLSLSPLLARACVLVSPCSDRRPPALPDSVIAHQHHEFHGAPQRQRISGS